MAWLSDKICKYLVNAEDFIILNLKNQYNKGFGE